MQTKYKITKDLELVLIDGENLLFVPDIYNKTLLLEGKTFIVEGEKYNIEGMSNETFSQFCSDMFHDDLDFLFDNKTTECQ